jgi:uncharacterized Ntn-hydrolase superfamily protein
MTWSLIALDKKTGELGIAAATKFFAVGARIPFVAPGFGAVATQALVNPFYGIDGLEYLRAGYAPDQVLDSLVTVDRGHAHRQAHVIDTKGRIAAHTGKSCLGWAGHVQGDACSVAGNMLAGPKVIEGTLEAYSNNSHLPLSRRMIVALQAGQASGGDRRGKQSASLLVSAMMNGRALMSGLMIIQIRWASWNGSKQLAARNGFAIVLLFRLAGIQRALLITRLSMRQWNHPCKRSKARRPYADYDGKLFWMAFRSRTKLWMKVSFSITGGDKMNGYMSGKPMVRLTLFMANTKGSQERTVVSKFSVL